MPRQNFLSRESFIDASEKQTKETILSIPSFVPNIRMIADNRIIESIKFSYQQPVKNLHYHIDVSILPLNDQYTRISLHATFANGQVFYSNADMAIALHDFESAIQAALKGDTSYYKPYQPKIKRSKKITQLFNTFKASIVVFFLRKKLS